MCEFSSKLIAWMDDELPGDQMAAVSQHLHGCGECRREIEVLGSVSRAFSAMVCTETRPRTERRLPRALIVAGAIAAVLLTVLMLRPHPLPEVRQPFVANVVPAQPRIPLANALGSEAFPVKRHRIRKQVPTQAVWMPVEPTVQIVIPADALLPPGALPDGISFVADLQLAANGSPASIALRQ